MKTYKSELRELRVKYKTNPKYWYSCHRGRLITDFESKKILSQEISQGCNMTYDESNLYHNTTVYSFILNDAVKEDLLYWLGTFNSNLMWWFLKNTGNVLRGGYFRFKTNYLKPFPVKRIEFNNPVEKTLYSKMIDNVVTQLKSILNISTTRIPAERIALQRQIDATDKQIDQLVYQLYGLTEKEINIVEENVK